MICFQKDKQHEYADAVDVCRYATGSSLSGPDALIQDFYAAECSNAVSALFLPYFARTQHTALTWCTCCFEII